MPIITYLSLAWPPACILSTSGGCRYYIIPAWCMLVVGVVVVLAILDHGL